jgi:general secretion pathway protein G
MIRKLKGFTLIEVMIVVSIVVILAILAMFMLTSNLTKSRDGKRKADLDRLKIAFEEYYGDQNAYPDTSMITNCGGDELRPYLPTIPCDPKTKKPYCYISRLVAPHFT